MEVQKHLRDTHLPSGSIIHGAETTRAHNDGRALVTCGRCGWQRRVTIPRVSKWTGLCLKCVKLRDQDEVLPTGSVIHWGERETDNPSRIMLTCGLCGRKRLASVQQHMSRRNWTGFCREHQSGAGLVELFNQLRPEPQGANRKKGQHKKNTKRKQAGRKLGSTTFNGAEFIEKAKRAILELRSEGYVGRSITGKAVAAKLHLGSSETGAEILRQNLRKSGEDRSVPEFIDALLAEKEK